MTEPCDMALAPDPTVSGSAETEPVFRVRALHKMFSLEGHTISVLRGLNVEIQEGQWVALVGRSGCGKTTLLHLLGALDTPSSGEVYCRGRGYHRLSRRQRTQLRREEIGFIFQSYHLFPELNALENVFLPALRWGMDRGAARTKAAELLSEMGLSMRLRHRPQELSGGEQQRVAIARALMNDPDIILADEPTGNLDVQAGAEITEILRRIHRDRSKTLVMVTHDLDLARQADQTYLIHAGAAEAREIGDSFSLDAELE